MHHDNTPTPALRATMTAYADALAQYQVPTQPGGREKGHGLTFVVGLHDDMKSITNELMDHVDQSRAAVAVAFAPASGADYPSTVIVMIDDGSLREVFTGCKFWLGERDDTLLIVSRNYAEERGHLAVGLGDLAHRPGAPATSLEAGFRRAEAWLGKVMREAASS